MRVKYPLIVLSVAYTAMLAFYSLMPFTAGVGTGPPSGNLLHFAAYAAYAAILLLAASKFTSGWKALLASFSIAVAVGAALELLQLYCPGRVCDLIDWFVDIAGAVAGIALIILLKQATRRKKRVM